MIAAVFDCVVYVQAAINSDGPAAACVSLVESGQVKVYTSPSILAEVRETLSQQKLRRKFPHLTDERVESFLQQIGEIAELVHDVPAVFSLPRDPDDAMYVDLALVALAAFLVSRDKDLLSLMDDNEFRNAHPELTTIDPAAFLAHVRTAAAKERGDGVN